VHRFFEERVAAGSARHFFSEWKFVELALLLEAIQPLVVVEFGSGTTTMLFAEYAVQKTGVRVVSVDENPAYQAAVRAAMATELSDAVTWVHCAAAFDGTGGAEVCFYSPEYRDEIRSRQIDLAYVDGPVCWSKQRPGEIIPCVDVVQLLSAGYVISNVLFDFRNDSASYLIDSPYGTLFDCDMGHTLQKARTGTYMGTSDRHHSPFRARPRLFARGAAGGPLRDE